MPQILGSSLATTSNINPRTLLPSSQDNTQVRGVITDEPDDLSVVLTTSLSTVFSTFTTSGTEVVPTTSLSTVFSTLFTTSGTEVVPTTIPVSTSTALVGTTIHRSPTSVPPAGTKSSNTPTIVGVVLGVAGLLGLVIFGLFIRLKHRRRSPLFQRGGSITNEIKRAPTSCPEESSNSRVSLSPEPGTPREPSGSTSNSRVFLPPEPGTPREPSILSASTSTEPHQTRSRITELVARTAALDTALAAARKDVQNGNAHLRGEIEQLRQLLQSDRALELTDEPPPSYGDLTS